MKCPPNEFWQKFLDNSLTLQEEADASTHLEQCSHCVLILEHLTSSVFDPSSTQSRTSEWREPTSGFSKELHRLRGLLPSAPTEPILTDATPRELPTVPGYTIEREIGRGGMGVVYLAQQNQLYRKVALKMVLAGQYAAQEQMIRFLAEAQTCAGLTHRNIVQIFEVGQHAGVPFYSMEYIEGGTLADYARHMAITPREAASLVADIARAMHLAHSRGIIHRDLKPANILLKEDTKEPTHPFIPKVTDFGLAKRFERDDGLTKSGALVGTPDYMAPEQIEPGITTVGPGVDIYAMGSILYYLTTGRPPFTATTPLQTLANVRQVEPVSPSLQNQVIPRDLSIICLHCLEKDPKRRYATAEELANDLQRFLSGEPITARAVSDMERLWKWAKRRPAIAGLSGLMVLIVLMSLGLVSWQWYRAEDALVNKAAHADAESKAKTKEAKARRASQLLSADYALEQGSEECRAGRFNQGLELMINALELLPDDEPDLEFAIRANINSWRDRRCTVSRTVGLGTMILTVAISPDGATALVGDRGNFMGMPSPAKAQLFRLDQLDQLPIWSVDHPSRIMSVAFDPQGERVAIGGSDGTTTIREAKTGKIYFPPLPHSGHVSSVAFSPDGETLAIGGHAKDPSIGELRFWNAHTGEPLGNLHLFAFEISSIAWSPDGKTIAIGGVDPKQANTGSAGIAVLFDYAKRIEVLPWMLHGDAVTTVAFHTDGKLLATGCLDGLVRLWDLPEGKTHSRPLPHPFPVNSLQFSHDGKMIATATGQALPGIRSGYGEIRVWDTYTSTLLTTPSFEPIPSNSQKMNSVAFSKDGLKLVAACDHGRVYLWTLPPPLIPRFSFPLEERADLLHSPDGKTLLLTILPPRLRWFAKQPCEIRIIDTNDGHTLGVLPHPVCVRARFSQDGKRILTFPWDPELGPGVWMWDATTGKSLPLPKVFGNSFFDVRFPSDGKTIITIATDGSFRRWDAANLTPLTDAISCLNADERPVAMDEKGEHLLGISPDDRRLIKLPECRTIAVLKKDKTPDLAPLNAGGGIPAIHGFFTKDGKSAITVDFFSKQTVERWSISDGSRQSSPADGKPWMIAGPHPDGHRFLLNLTTSRTAQFWDANDGKLQVANIPVQGDIAIDPSGKYIAATQGGTDPQVQLWSVTGKAIGPKLPHAALYALSFNPIDRWLVTSSFSKNVKVWPLPEAMSGTPSEIRAALFHSNANKLSDAKAADK